MASKILIIIVGATAVGKTSLSISVAKELNAEIISCDARQFYRELEIGTAKPSLAELNEVMHHFINSHSVENYYSAGDFGRDVHAFLDTYFLEKDIAIMTGGSGLFVKAVVEGLDDMPAVPAKLRDGLMKRADLEGIDILAQDLILADPDIVGLIDLKNRQRVVRALEVTIFTGKPFSSFHSQTKKNNAFRIIKIGIDRPREELYERINNRVDAMISEGLVEEVKSLAAFKDLNALQTVGYKEVFLLLKDEIDFVTMIDLIKRNTRRYAKRQLTWFRNQDIFQWFGADELDKIKDFLKNKVYEINNSF